MWQKGEIGRRSRNRRRSRNQKSWFAEVKSACSLPFTTSNLGSSLFSPNHTMPHHHVMATSSNLGFFLFHKENSRFEIDNIGSFPFSLFITSTTFSPATAFQIAEMLTFVKTNGLFWWEALLVGWWRVELVLFLCLFWWKPSWWVGSVQNLRAGHFPLVTLVTLVRPIEGGVGWGWEINSYGWFCVLKLKQSQT